VGAEEEEDEDVEALIVSRLDEVIEWKLTGCDV